MVAVTEDFELILQQLFGFCIAEACANGIFLQADEVGRTPTERVGRLFKFGAQINAHKHGIVGADRDRDAEFVQFSERVFFQTGVQFHQVGSRGDVKGDALVGQTAQQDRIGDGAHAVIDAHCTQNVKCFPDALGRGGLTGVYRDGKTGVLGFQKGVAQYAIGLLGNCFVAVYRQTHQARMTVSGHPAHQRQRLLFGLRAQQGDEQAAVGVAVLVSLIEAFQNAGNQLLVRECFPVRGIVVITSAYMMFCEAA